MSKMPQTSTASCPNIRETAKRRRGSKGTIYGPITWICARTQRPHFARWAAQDVLSAEWAESSFDLCAVAGVCLGVDASTLLAVFALPLHSMARSSTRRALLIITASNAWFGACLCLCGATTVVADFSIPEMFGLSGEAHGTRAHTAGIALARAQAETIVRVGPGSGPCGARCTQRCARRPGKHSQIAR